MDQPFLVIKNGTPLALLSSRERVRRLIQETGGWNLWEVWDMSLYPPRKIDVPRGSR